MGKFADFYVVSPAEAGVAACSMGESKQWPHHHIKQIDVFQVATLYDLLRGVESEHTWQLFQQRVEPEIAVDEMDEEAEYDDGGSSFLVATFPADFTEHLARLSETERNNLAERWQAHPNFFWSRNAGVASTLVGELCHLSTLAVQQKEIVILAESGD